MCIRDSARIVQNRRGSRRVDPRAWPGRTMWSSLARCLQPGPNRGTGLTARNGQHWRGSVPSRTIRTVGAAPAEGTVLLGKLRVENVLGEGGMGVVCRAHHLHLDQPVAI